MTPPAAATSHRSRKLRRSPVPRAPRRVSGPRRPPRAALAGAGGAAVARPPLSLRLGRRAMRVGDARVLDRLVRGRAWIAIVAAALIGIVFMQVSMLKLNAGVSRAVTAADTLERQNSSLRADISKLGSGERVQDAATNQGMVTPAAGDVHYLNAQAASGARAAASIKPPKPVAPTLGAAATGAAATGAAANGATATVAANATGAAASGAAATGATGTGAAATGATATGATGTGAAGAANGATGTGATGTGAAGAANGAASPNGAATGTGAAATTNGGTATGAAQTATGAASSPTQQTAPPATGTAAQTGAVAGGATAGTPGEG
jgi:cell division protein FtsL